MSCEIYGYVCPKIDGAFNNTAGIVAKQDVGRGTSRSKYMLMDK